MLKFSKVKTEIKTMNFKALFENKKSVTVGHIGGSITEQEGYGKVFTAHLRIIAFLVEKP